MIRPDSETQLIFVISTSLLADDSHLWQNVIDDTHCQVVQMSSGIYLYQRTIFWTCRPNANVYLRFCDQKKNQVISSKRLVWTHRD